MKKLVLKLLFCVSLLFVAKVSFADPVLTITGYSNSTINGVSSGNIAYGTSPVVLYGFSVTNAGSGATNGIINKLRFDVTGAPVSQFFTGLTLVSADGVNYTSATKTNVGGASFDGSSNTLVISNLSESINVGATKYYFIVGSFNTINNNLPQNNEQLTYKDVTVQGVNSGNPTNSTAVSPAGAQMNLQSPIVTINNYSNSNSYTGTGVSGNNTYYLLGFNLTYSGPTNMHQLVLNVTYPSGGEGFNSGYINSVDLVDASTLTRPSYISGVQNNGGTIVVDFNINSPQSGSANNYLLKVSFNDFNNHHPTAFNICMPTGNGFASNLCGNKSNCTINNQYTVTSTGTSCSQTYVQAVPAVPTVTTTTPAFVTSTSATLGGSITAVGYPNITEYGFVYSTSNNPSITSGTKVVMGTSASSATSFSQSVTTLTQGTTYYVVAYATNNTGTAYGSVLNFTTPSSITVTVPVDKDATANSVPENSANGTYVGLRAYSTDSGTGYGTTNIALGKTTYTSSVYNNGGNVGANAVDGNSTSTRWESAWTDQQWMTVDLGAAYDIRRVRLIWEGAYGKDYTIQASNDNSTWTTIKTVTGNTTLTNDLTGFTNATIPYRYIKMNGTLRGTGYGYSLFEFEVYTAPIVYTLSDNAGGRFAINSGTGVVTVANGALLDYETNQSHNITVVATSGSASASATFTINVTDVNEPPTITSNGGGTAASISIAAGTSAVTTVKATDPDAGTVLTYSIAGGADQAKFSIDPSLGTLTFNTSSGLSAANNNVYTVSVKATDNGSPALSSQTQTLTVTITGIVAPTVATPVTLCGAGSVTLTAAGAAPGGGTYNWYLDATTTTPAYTSTSNTYAPFIASPSTDFYVTYTANSSTTARVKVTVTMNPKASSSISAPMLAFPFNGNANDISGNGNNGTVSPNGTFALNTITQAPPSLIADRTGNLASAYNFTSTGNSNPQFIYTSTSYNPVPSIFSISVWFKTTTKTGGKIVGYGTDQTSYYNVVQDRNLYMLNDGRLTFGVFSSSAVTVTTTNSYNDGLWHHVVATLGTTNGFKIYVDGASQTPATVAYAAPQGIPGYWRIGGDGLLNWPNRPTSDYFNGVLDDIAIYNHELTATEAADNDMNLYQFSAGYCASNPLTITAQAIPNATYSWVDNDTPTATPLTTQTVTFPVATTTYYKLTTTVNGCSNTAIVTPTNLTYTWNGSVSSSVNNAANWTNTSTGIVGSAPTLTSGLESIIIPSGLPTNRYPTLAANTSIYTLTMGTGATLGLATFTLNVGCNIINNNNTGNAITYNSANTTSGISWASTTNKVQNYYGSNTAFPLQVTKMATNNSLTNSIVNINSGKVDIYNLLDINAGSLNVAATGTLTLKSIATQTAAVDAIPSAYKITGNVNVERFIAGQSSGTTADNTRNYRLLSSPVNANAVTDNTSATAYSTLSYLSATGTYSGVFTGGPNGPSAGFSYTNATPTTYLYNEALTPSNATFNSGNFKGLTDITGNPIKLYNDAGTVAGGQNATMYAGNGFMVYYVGNNLTSTGKGARVNGVYLPPDASTMTAIGTLNQGNQPVKLWNATAIGLSYAKTHYCLVGNPYAAAIDWDTYGSGITSTGVGKTIYIFDYTSKNYGAYQAGIPGSATNNASNIIQSGQGFFVQTTAASPTLTFTEGAKSVAKPNFSNPKFMGLPVVASTPLQLLRLKLAKDTINKDETVMVFQDEAKNEIEDGVDANRINGIGNISTIASYAKGSPTMLSINHMHSIDSTTRVKLYVNMTSSVGVIDTLSATGFETLDPRYDAFLIDKFKKDSLQISLYNKYNFNITTDTASYGANRFELVFHKKPGLNYRLLSFAGKKVNNTVQLTWRVENEQNLTGFNVEKPDGTKQFVSVYALQSDGKGTYTWTDQAPAVGSNSYRLRQNDPFNTISYSNTISVNFENSIFASEFMTVYPNPTINEMNVKLNVDNVPNQVRLKIYDSTGQLKLNKVTNGNNIQENIGNLLPGVYVVQIFDNVTQSMIGQKKVTKAR